MENYSKQDLEKAKQEGQLSADITQIKNDVVEIKRGMEKNLVTKDELATFKAEIAPYIMAVKGLLSLIVTSVVIAILYLVIKK